MMYSLSTRRRRSACVVSETRKDSSIRLAAILESWDHSVEVEKVQCSGMAHSRSIHVGMLGEEAVNLIVLKCQTFYGHVLSRSDETPPLTSPRPRPR